MRVLGWDIGGSNTKVAAVADGRVAAAVSRRFEVRLAPDELTHGAGAVSRLRRPRRRSTRTP